MTDIRCIAFCPHCGHPSPQVLALTQRYTETLHSTDGEVFEGVDGVYFVAVCETCSQLILYGQIGIAAPPEKFPSADLVWPKVGSLHEAVPKRVLQIYQEAHAIRNVAPNAFAVQIRRSLEALCDDRGAKPGTLSKRLDELVARGELPPVLGEMTGVLRLLGNIGAHAASADVHLGQVPALDDFFRAVVEYVYVAPAKVKAFRGQLQDLGATKTEDA